MENPEPNIPESSGAPPFPQEKIDRGCRCGAYNGQWECICPDFQKRHNMSELHCMDTGEFQHCFSDNIAKKAVTPETFAEKYATTLLTLVWLRACDIAARLEWDCAELRDSVKAACPNVDKVEKRHQAHNGTDKAPVMRAAKSPAGNPKKNEEAKRAEGEKKACQDLAALFPELPHHSCADLINTVQLKWKGKKVNIEEAKHDKHLGDTTDLEMELTREWPDVEWSTDDE